MKRIISFIMLLLFIMMPAAQAVSIGGGLTVPENAASIADDSWYYDTAISLATDTWDMATNPLYLRYHLFDVLDEMYAQVDALIDMRKDAPGRAFVLEGVSRSRLLRGLKDAEISGAALEKHLNMRMQDMRRTGFMAQEYVMQGISVYSEAITYYVLPDNFQPQMIVLDYGEAIVNVQFLELTSGVGMAAATLVTLADGVSAEDIMAEIAVPGVYSEPVEITIE